MKILDSIWWTHQYRHIGAVLIRSHGNTYKAYIGVPEHSLGVDQDADEQFIYKHGAKLSEKQALGIFPQLVGETYGK
jgi:hypothetical protein